MCMRLTGDFQQMNCCCSQLWDNWLCMGGKGVALSQCPGGVCVLQSCYASLLIFS